MKARQKVILVVFFLLSVGMIFGLDFSPPSREDDILSLELIPSLSAQNKYPILDGQLEPPKIFGGFRGNLFYRSLWFDILIDWGISNEGEIAPQLEQHFGAWSFLMYDTRLFFHTPDKVFSATAGRGPHRDTVDSPYSVFINSESIPAFHLEISYQKDGFFYTSRWVQLNYRSKYQYQATGVDNPFPAPDPSWDEGYEGTWLDKGANYKVMGIKLGNWRFGIQDVVIYLERNFDVEYFINPLPQYFIQIINTAVGRPWSQAGNDKSFMGLFADWTPEGSAWSAQLLVDDINVSFLPGINKSSAIKTKIAWSLGGWMDFDFGRLGFYHGGATKYTFAATYTAHHWDDYKDDPGFIKIPYSILPYEATYYPATAYDNNRPIDYTQNYFGYKYGENNLAFLVDFQREFFAGSNWAFGFYSSFEWVINGAKSPANPWHEYYNGGQTEAKIVMFDGDVEHLLRLSAAFRKPLPFNLVFNLDIIGGVAINAMKLVSVAPVVTDVVNYSGWEEPKIYVPQKGLVEPVFKVTLGLSWYIPLMKKHR